MFLGRYEAVRLLGEGGMGRVYLARQTDLGRQVVVKVMHDHIAADPKFRERFQRETLLMARFQHPYVVTLYDASLSDPQGPCIVMEYIRGITLDGLLQKNTRLGPARVGRLLGQLCEALQAAHVEAIVHRDLKPANLMVVDPDTPYEKIKVMDFGLAKLVDSRPMKHDRATDTGADFAVGTPGYISPEQVRGDDIDHRSDLYSLGVILFELLTGRLPFAGKETMDVLLAHATEPPPSFSALGAATWVSPAIESVVQSCLAKNPADRPASARDLAELYETALAMEFEPVEQPASTETDGATADGAGADGTSANGTAANDNAPPGANGAASNGVAANGAANGTPPNKLVSALPNTAAKRGVYDPDVVVHRMEAWMPEAIAAYKLRGFVQDVGGEVLESVPGRIRVRLGGKGSLYHTNNSSLSWLGLGRKTAVVDVELNLERSTSNPGQQNLLHITVKMRSPELGAATNPDWRARCTRIFCDLRGYLAGASVS
jgi:serine/threonine-protein kinase